MVSENSIETLASLLIAAALVPFAVAWLWKSFRVCRLADGLKDAAKNLSRWLKENPGKHYAHPDFQALLERCLERHLALVLAQGGWELGQQECFCEIARLCLDLSAFRRRHEEILGKLRKARLSPFVDP